MSILGGAVGGMPRIGSLKATSPRIIFRDGQVMWELSGGKVIDGSKSRDPDNVSAEYVLRPGLVMGKITSSGKYAPSILGTLNAAYTAGGTTLTVLARVVTEILRRIGSSGTLTIVGPPTAAGVVNRETVTFSAAAGTSITITALINSYVAGSYIMGADGSQAPVTLIPEKNAGTGMVVVDSDLTTNLDTPFDWFPIGGVIISANIINYPSDASLKTWLKTQLSTIPGGKFAFDDTW